MLKVHLNVLAPVIMLAAKLETLDADFKAHHLQIVDLINDDDEEELEKEQETLDKHDEDVTSHVVRLQQSSTPVVSGNRKASSRKLLRLECCLNSTEEILVALPGDDGVSLLEQHCEQLSDHKKELAAVYEDLVSLDLEDEDDLFVLHARLDLDAPTKSRS